MPSAAFPHAYPFRFVDTVSRPAQEGFAGGAVRIRVSANSRAAMGAGWGSPLLYAEAIAQAALLLEGGDAEAGRRGFLAGLSDFEIARLPLAGETLDVDVRLAGQFGPVFRFDGRVVSGEETLAKGGVLVRKGDMDEGR
jgi:3-hydroxymyristoyl/3-hydroxydecanoyl-(acyl carrier protein) dehydratase